LQLLSHRINAVLEYTDPTHYKEAIKVNEALSREFPGFRALTVIDPLVYEGREIIFNRVSGLHMDGQDPPLSWAILAAFGNFTGGRVYIQSLNLFIRYEPGDVIAIRGRVLPHQIADDFIGQRITIPHFTHASVWRAVKNDTVFVK